MSNNSTRSIGLTALVGLFAFYGFTAHNLKIGSISSSGIVIKYSKRSLASNTRPDFTCPPAVLEIDVNDFAASCVHSLTSRTLENGDTEHSVIVSYRGHVSTGTRVYPAQSVAAYDIDSTDFIIGLVRRSRHEFDTSPEGIEYLETLASAAIEAAEAEAAVAEEAIEPEEDVEVAESPATVERNPEDGPAPAVIPGEAVADEDGETGAIDSDGSVPEVDVEVASVDPAPTNGRPAITPPSEESGDGSGEVELSGETSGDADEFNQAMEDFSELEAAYNACETSPDQDSEIESIISDYGRAVNNYAQRLADFEDSDDEDAVSPFEALSNRNQRKIDSFITEVNGLSSIEGEATNRTEADRFNCLVARASAIEDAEAQYNYYGENIRPVLVDQMQSAGSIDEFTTMTNALGNEYENFVQLADSNPQIRGAFNADYRGAHANVLLADNTRANAIAETLAEPARGQELQRLREQREQIGINFEQRISELRANNPALEQHINLIGQQWAQHSSTLELSAVAVNPLAAAVNASSGVPTQAELDAARAQTEVNLQAMFDRISAWAGTGSGNARQGNPQSRGQMGQGNGTTVHQFGDVVEEQGSLQ